MVSPRPSCMSLLLSTTASPPSALIATSNDTRVRVEGLSKIIASVLPASRGWRSFGPSDFSSLA